MFNHHLLLGGTFADSSVLGFLGISLFLFPCFPQPPSHEGSTLLALYLPYFLPWEWRKPLSPPPIRDASHLHSWIPGPGTALGTEWVLREWSPWLHSADSIRNLSQPRPCPPAPPEDAWPVSTGSSDDGRGNQRWPRWKHQALGPSQVKHPGIKKNKQQKKEKPQLLSEPVIFTWLGGRDDFEEWAVPLLLPAGLPPLEVG